MTKITDLIEWDYLGAKHSIYVKHFFDDDRRKGATIIFEDLTRDTVTEIVIPSRVFPKFLRAING
ncbi:MAG: hypothetical protein WC676_02025 [Candidatus Omnitrophota bacterium]